MVRKEYLQHLRTLNSYCNCPALAELFNQRRKMKKLEQLCDRYQAESDTESPKQGDEDFLRLYLEKVLELEEEGVKYGFMLARHIQQKLLKETENTDNGRIRPQIISINCASCNQQIDIIAEED